MRRKQIIYSWMTALLLLLTITGCKDTLSNLLDGDTPDLQGEVISFTSQLPAVQGSTKTRTTVNTELLNGYKAINQNYDFTVTMLKDGDTAFGMNQNYSASSESTDGKLTARDPLYWQDNVNKYGFKAVAGSDVVAADQTDAATWLKQDKLVGFGYEPLLGDDNNAPVDKLDDYNYRTNKEWYQANKLWMSADGQTLVSDDEYKRIPLFLQHQRSLITVIVKAGDGVKREDVLAETASTKLDTHIYSYSETTTGDATTTETTVKTTEVSPLLGKETVTYDKDVNGEAEDAVVARYDAIVEPYNYVPTTAEEDGPKICSINLGGQHFSFYANNDSRYTAYNELSTDEDKENSDFYKAYKLQAGDNLVITVTLSRDSRKILMTAYVQPWTDAVTTYVCDDFGTSGSPTVISEKQDLIDFLNNEKANVAGNVAILNTDGIDLTEEDWGQNYNLNAILNLGNHTLTVNKRLFNSIASSGSLINGTLKVKNCPDVKTLVCQTNSGTVDRLSLVNDDEDNRAVVTRAAVAETNYGYITNITSHIKVEGTADGDATTYIGGIAGVSKSESGTLIPSITGCTVDARVGIANGETSVKGGGIVGAANGYVNGNTFEYGVTLSQENVRNIVYANVSDDNNLNLMASDNEWPTVAANSVDGLATALTNARDEEYQYTAVLDCQEELKKLVDKNSSYNATGKSYRLSDNFSVLSQDWTLGEKNDLTDNTAWGNVLFTLDGNNKTITLGGTQTIEYADTKNATDKTTTPTAPMLFCNIMGTVKDLTILCAESLYGIPTYGESGSNTSLDICAPLAYSVIGGTVENVDVRAVQKSDGEYPAVIAAIPAGLVVWANQSATIKNCSSDMDVYMRVSGNFTQEADARLYAGGLIAQVAQATVTQCQFEPRTDYVFKCLQGSGTYAGNANLIFGGIIGGTVVKSTSTKEIPEVTITDCSSFYSFDADKVNYTEGSVLGRSIYSSSGNTNVNGVNKSACQGNWWPTGAKAVGQGGADEKTIGKKNSVTPERK